MKSSVHPSKKSPVHTSKKPPVHTSKKQPVHASNIAPMLRGNREGQQRPPKTAALVARTIVSEISALQLSSGDMLPSEKEMLSQYSVGRGTLREALRFLEMQGLITIKPGPGGGPTISTPGSRYLAGTLSIVLQFAQTPFRAIVEARSVIEPAVAAAAATRIDGEHLQLIAASLERMTANTGNTVVFLEENARFHDLIAWASGNMVFGYLLSSLQWISDGSVLGVQYPEWAQRAVSKVHRGIYRSIAAGNAEQAGTRMQDHYAQYLGYLSEYYPEVLEQRISWDRLPT